MSRRFGHSWPIGADSAGRGGRLLLRSGRLSASVPPEGVGFTVDTPDAEVIDLDAVIIATPCHARVRAAILACMKGLDIYAEKPLHFSIPEGRARSSWARQLR